MRTLFCNLHSLLHRSIELTTGSRHSLQTAPKSAKCSPLIDALADELLQDVRMAGLVKLHRGMGTVGRGRLWAGSDGGRLGRLWQMLRCAHIDKKGGKETFAALCIKVRYADFAVIRLSSYDGGFRPSRLLVCMR